MAAFALAPSTRTSFRDVMRGPAAKGKTYDAHGCPSDFDISPTDLAGTWYGNGHCCTPKCEKVVVTPNCCGFRACVYFYGCPCYCDQYSTCEQCKGTNKNMYISWLGHSLSTAVDKDHFHCVDMCSLKPGSPCGLCGFVREGAAEAVTIQSGTPAQAAAPAEATPEDVKIEGGAPTVSGMVR